MQLVQGGPRPPVVVIQEERTPEQQAEDQARRDRFMANVRWFEAHVADLRTNYAGQYVTISCGEAFADPDVRASLEKARAAHPEDRGAYLTQYFRPGPAVRA